MNQERILNWLEKEKQKDKIDIESEKNKIIKDIKKISKDEIFSKPKKLSLWNRIKIIIWGR